MIKERPCSSNKYSRNSWKKFVYDKPFEEISLEQFKGIATSSPGWKLIRENDKQYNIMSNFNNLDEWVKEALWNFDPQLYDTYKGYSKVPKVGRAYHSLLNYCGPARYKTQVQDDLMPYYEDQLKLMRNNFRPVHTLNIDTALRKLPQNTSAGYSFPGRKKGEVLEECRAKVLSMIDDFKNNKKVEQIPSKMALRGHLSPVDENKTRVVWVSPMENIVLESMLFRGFTKQLNMFAQWKEIILTGDQSMQRLTQYLGSKPELSFTNVDFSGWDSIRARFILKDIFYRVLKPSMVLDEEWKENAFDYLVEAFINTHLLLPDGTVISKTTGVPSGSFLTLLINSIAVYVVTTACLKFMKVPFVEEKVLGDDFSFKTPYMTDLQLRGMVKKLASLLMDNFGLLIKDKKVITTNILEERKFIGYRIRQSQLYREDDDWMLSALYPESLVKNISISFTRMYAYLLIGGYQSPLFRRFYQYYLTAYYDALESYGTDVFREDILLHGNLRVFKHVFGVDIANFENFDIATFTRIRAFKIPYFVTLGANINI